MKLKPLIKTHWLSSQNPMMVGLGGIKRVIFAPPPGLLDFDFNIGSENQGPAVLNHQVRQIEPSAEKQKEILSQSFTLARDLYWNVFSGFDFQSFRVTPQPLQKLARSIFVETEEGEFISLVGLQQRSHLPPFLNPQFYLQDRSVNWSKALDSHAESFMQPLKLMGHQRRSDEFKKVWFLILEILAWSFQRQRQVGDLECLIQLDRLYHLAEVEFAKAKPLVATVQAKPEPQEMSLIKIWQGCDPHLTEGYLKLHASSWLAEVEGASNEKREAEGEEIRLLQERISSHSGAQQANHRWEVAYAKSQIGLKSLSRSLEQLEIHIGSQNIVYFNSTITRGDDFRPSLKLREWDGVMHLSTEFFVSSLNLVHANLPSQTRKILGPFAGGLDQFFQIDRKDVASRLPQYRSQDLSFLKHQGLLLFVLLEMMNWVLSKPLTSGEVIEFVSDLESPEADRQYEKLLQYLKKTIPGLLGKTGLQFEEILSKDVKNLFLDFADRIYKALTDDRSVVLWHDQIIRLQQIQKKVLPILRFLILQSVESSQGKFLTKSQSAVGTKLLDQLHLWCEPELWTRTTDGIQKEPRWIEIGLFNKGLISLLFELLDEGFEIELNGVPFLSQENPFDFIFSVSSSEIKEDSNWFDLHPQIFFNGEKVRLEDLRFNFSPDQVGFIEFRGQIYRIDKRQIPTLKSLTKFWNKIQGVKTVSKRNRFGEKVYQLDRSMALELLMLKVQGIKVEADGEWKRIFDYFESGLGAEKIQLPENTVQTLIPHQREGAQWLHDLYQLRLGAILADEMGLGKTFQILAFLMSLQGQKELQKSLVIVPTSLVYNWVEEKKKFSPGLPVEVFQAKDKNSLDHKMLSEDEFVLVATYGLLCENLDFFQKHDWNIVVFDEAQNLKNITSQRSVAARSLKARFKVCLTGTPMENNYLEFFSLCDLVVPGSLGDVDTFRKSFYNREVPLELIKELKLVTKPLVLRRTKEQVKLNLPVKTVQRVLLPFAPQQREIYKRMAMRFSKQVEDLVQSQGERKAQIAMFAALMRLRQICSDPAAVPGVEYTETPVKVEHFLNSLSEHLENDESVIVFTQFLSTLERISSELKKAGLEHSVLQGQVTAKDRLKIIESFQKSSKPSVLLATLKTGGVGLNLTKASIVYHLEPWWNPAVENQATDRAHRMGQTKDVKVFNLLIEGSLEERIADLKVKKQTQFDRLFGVQENSEEVEQASLETSNLLTKDDFIFLLK